MFENKKVECYIINTGYFLEQKIPKEVSIKIVEAIVDGTGEFKNFGRLGGIIKTMDIPGFEPPFGEKSYVDILLAGFQGRLVYLDSLKEFKSGRDNLPEEAFQAIRDIADTLSRLD